MLKFQGFPYEDCVVGDRKDARQKITKKVPYVFRSNYSKRLSLSYARDELVDLLGGETMKPAEKVKNLHEFFNDFNKRWPQYVIGPENMRLTVEEDIQYCQEFRISQNCRGQMKSRLLEFGKDFFAATRAYSAVKKQMGIDERAEMGNSDTGALEEDPSEKLEEMEKAVVERINTVYGLGALDLSGEFAEKLWLSLVVRRKGRFISAVVRLANCTRSSKEAKTILVREGTFPAQFVRYIVFYE